MAVNVIVSHNRANAAHEVGKGGDRGPWNNVIGAGILTYPTERIDIRSTVPVKGPMVTGRRCSSVLKLDKYASDNVFDRGLRTKRNGQP